jgi:hypothetical protein
MLFKAHLQPLDITCLIRTDVARGARRGRRTSIARP